MKGQPSIDTLKNKFDETQKMVGELEDSLQQLSNIFPMDINFRITQLRAAISKSKTKRESFLDEFEPKIQLPDFTDQKYFNDLSEKTSQEIRSHFNEIEDSQSLFFNKFIREHPGPYYKTVEEPQTYPVDKLDKLRSLLQQDKDKLNNKLNILSQKVSLIAATNANDDKLQLDPIKQSIDSQEQQLTEISTQIQEIQMMLEVQKNRQSKSNDDYDDDDKMSPAEKQLQDAFDQYNKLDESIDREVTLFNMMSTSLISDLDMIKASLSGVALKEKGIDDVIQKTNPILEKSKIKSENLQDSFEKFSARIKKAKEDREKQMETEELQALKGKCAHLQEEDSKQLQSTKSLVDELTQEIEALTFNT